MIDPCCLKQGEKDDKIIAVCADDPEYKHYNDIKELPPHRLAEIRRFFEDCILIYLQMHFIYKQLTYERLSTKKSSPVHEAPAMRDSGEGFIVRSLILLYKRLFLGLESVTSRS